LRVAPLEPVIGCDRRLAIEEPFARCIDWWS
jgi:hypothetical protein